MTGTRNPVDARTVEDLLRIDGRIKYVHFWGHEPSPDGLSAACLSPWWPADFTIDDITYRTAEHFMMAEKARLFADTETVERILATDHPERAERLGREITDFDEEVWEGERFEIAVRGNVAKFGQNHDLGEFLLGTKERVLVAAGPEDRVWGIGIGWDDENAERPRYWRGRNLLGFALMEARARLSAQNPTT